VDDEWQDPLAITNVPLLEGEAVHVLGEEVYGNSVYCPLNFAITIKLL
jgi:hypothetical protein